MFRTLLESSPRPRGYRGWVVPSVVVHAVAIVFATSASGKRPPVVPSMPEPGVYLSPAKPMHSERRTHGEQRRGTTTTSGRSLPTFGEIAVGVQPPSIDIELPTDGVRPDAGEFTSTLTGSNRVGEGLPIDDIYSESTVEVPVAADPSSPSPRYPESLRRMNVEGRVVAEFVVDSLGRVEVESFRSVESNDAVFTASVRDVLPRLRFLPARAHRHAVRQWVRQEFVFRIAP